jgi:EAL domain-containing protein (putative c-di-GMP-specific phosphodiesterase class I)
MIEPLKGCSRCGKLPSAGEAAGNLYLWFPTPHTLAKVRRRLDQAGRVHRYLSASQSLRVPAEAGQAAELAALLAGALGDQENEDTRVLFLEGDRRLGLADYSRVVSLARFLAARRADWVLDLLRERRLTSLFQPIVEAADPGTVFAYESLLRGIGEDGRLIGPDRLFAAAHDRDLLFQLDLAGRQTAIREIVRHGTGSRVFVNFTPTSIYDPAFCLRSTVALIRETGLTPDRVVFEVIESEQVRDLAHLEAILNVYRNYGFQVALDDLGAGYSSLNLMSRLRPDFVKLDRELIRRVDEDPYKAVIAEKLLELARQLGIRTVAEGVETDGELDWVRCHGADYVQGYRIAAPASPPPLPAAPGRLGTGAAGVAVS